MNKKSDKGGGGNPWKKEQNKIIQSNNKSAEEKFRREQEKLQAAVQKHLEEQDYESSSDEEALESESILNSVFQNYGQFVSNASGIEKTQQFLENTFQSGAAICLICIGSVKRSDPVWNCLECYGYFHLVCIQMWARDSLQQQKLTQDELPAFRKTKISWACPKCRHDYEQTDVPQKYFCFCQKVEDPPYHPWLIPHSCGETCNKKLQPECGHSCLLLCHPGPCPPCPKTVKTYCHCKKKGPNQQRCSKKLWSCNSKCEKSLLCKKHKCENICHSGDCPPCNKESIQKCKCGLKERKQPCFNPTWQCEKVCGKPFSCGFHKCTLVCHEGSCGECPSSLERSCPCGKNKFLLPCTVDVPACNDTCDKLLDCGIHRCSQKCHKEKCGMCLEIEVKLCRCGLHKKSLPCQKSFQCETKCKRMKNCLKHPCNRKCCDLLCPPCEKPCGKTLKCGYHKCPSVCHRGQCYPCPQVAQVKCRCGGTTITVPCGRQKKTSPPKCNKLCTIAPTCHHPSREPHNCHFGECRPCKQICGKDRERCSHKCPAPCHSSVWVKIQDNHQPAGPWEVTKPKMKRCNLPCPDCEVPVPITCLGGHETSDWPCHKAQPSSCHRPCGRLLRCGNHTCEKPCHVVTGAGDGIQAGENCMECDSECLRTRPEGCTHPCSKPCHPGPCPPCNLNLKMKCHCGICVLFVYCDQMTNGDEKFRETVLSCGNKCPKDYPCGHKCKSTCHPGDCPDPNSCKKKVKLSCKCGRLKKDLPCDVVRLEKKTRIECDAVCLSILEEEKKVREQEMEKKRIEEERKNREEVEKFERKLQQGRRKQRERYEPKEEPSFLSRRWPVLLGVFVALVAVTFFIWK
ncbi:hypothetical protein RUM43_002632 [Polyplax serrata]|uniref:PHD-type domain-containing protein n=1 Tax=Polyplax serrata TaxID=468196 RepID=A0AAN8NZE9_POLSC